MRIDGTFRHALLVSGLLVGCGSSHGAGGDGGTGTDGGGECGPFAGTCMDDCCESSQPPSFDDRCNAVCPPGLHLVDRCAPLPDCGGCGAIDPGLCFDDACCTSSVPAEIDYGTCTARCPTGYSPEGECTPDPAADCAAPWAACSVSSDCVLTANTCCGVCGAPTASDVAAVNGDRVDDYRASVCPDPGPCPACATMPNPALGATCGGGLCQVFDVRTLPLSACTTDADCRLRATACCECGADVSPYALIAVRADAEADYAALVCSGEACEECAPVYPTDVEAFCADDGHCDVRSGA